MSHRGRNTNTPWPTKGPATPDPYVPTTHHRVEPPNIPRDIISPTPHLREDQTPNQLADYGSVALTSPVRRCDHRLNFLKRVVELLFVVRVLAGVHIPTWVWHKSVARVHSQAEDALPI